MPIDIVQFLESQVWIKTHESSIPQLPPPHDCHVCILCKGSIDGPPMCIPSGVSNSVKYNNHHFDEQGVLEWPPSLSSSNFEIDKSISGTCYFYTYPTQIEVISGSKSTLTTPCPEILTFIYKDSSEKISQLFVDITIYSHRVSSSLSTLESNESQTSVPRQFLLRFRIKNQYKIFYLQIEYLVLCITPTRMDLMNACISCLQSSFPSKRNVNDMNGSTECHKICLQNRLNYRKRRWCDFVNNSLLQMASKVSSDATLHEIDITADFPIISCISTLEEVDAVSSFHKCRKNLIRNCLDRLQSCDGSNLVPTLVSVLSTLNESDLRKLLWEIPSYPSCS